MKVVMRPAAGRLAAMLMGGVVVASLLAACTSPEANSAKSTSTTSATAPQQVPSPPSLVVGTPVVNRRGLRFGTPVPDQGVSCSLGACWSVIVTARGYVYPVQGSYDYPVSEAVTIPWHIAGPALAGPGVKIPDHFIEVDPRSAARALIWTGPNTFVSTHDGGRRWYRITGITHRVAIGFDGAQEVGITIGLPGAHACDYYFTYSSVGGVVWRRGPALQSFVTTAIGWQTPSCLANEKSETILQMPK